MLRVIVCDSRKAYFGVKTLTLADFTGSMQCKVSVVITDEVSPVTSLKKWNSSLG